jgi:hypothetical protein
MGNVTGCNSARESKSKERVRQLEEFNGTKARIYGYNTQADVIITFTNWVSQEDVDTWVEFPKGEVTVIEWAHHEIDRIVHDPSKSHFIVFAMFMNDKEPPIETEGLDPDARMVTDHCLMLELLKKQ